MMRSGPKRESTLHLLGGNSTLPSPFLPCQNSAVISFWNRGCCAPAATGMSHRFASETMRSAFSRPIAAVTFPGTTVIARTSNSGELSARISARASSVPGSVSKIIFLAAEAGLANTATSKITESTGNAPIGRRPRYATASWRIFICSRKDWRCSLASWIWECQGQSAVNQEWRTALFSGQLLFRRCESSHLTDTVLNDQRPALRLGRGCAFQHCRRHRFLLRLRLLAAKSPCRSEENLLRPHCLPSPQSRDLREPKCALVR